MDTKSAVTGKAVARFIRMSPTKVARVLNQIRGCTYEEALILLEFLPYRACEPVWQVVQSAASNAQNQYGINKQDLVISNTFVSPGPTLRHLYQEHKDVRMRLKNERVTLLQLLKVKIKYIKINR